LKIIIRLDQGAEKVHIRRNFNALIYLPAQALKKCWHFVGNFANKKYKKTKHLQSVCQHTFTCYLLDSKGSAGKCCHSL
jgi:hypothetical protein